MATNLPSIPTTFTLCLRIISNIIYYCTVKKNKRNMQFVDPKIRQSFASQPEFCISIEIYCYMSAHQQNAQLRVAIYLRLLCISHTQTLRFRNCSLLSTQPVDNGAFVGQQLFRPSQPTFFADNRAKMEASRMRPGNCTVDKEPSRGSRVRFGISKSPPAAVSTAKCHSLLWP